MKISKLTMLDFNRQFGEGKLRYYKRNTSNVNLDQNSANESISAQDLLLLGLSIVVVTCGVVLIVAHFSNNEVKIKKEHDSCSQSV